MASEVIMPKAGMAMEEGTIVKWYKQEGDTVTVGEPLLEIITDKVNMEVEAEVSGTLLEIIGKEGDVLPVLSVIAYIGEKDEKNKDQENKDQENEAEKNQEKLRATPAARFEARQRGIDLRDIKGTGPEGRIQKQDIPDGADKLKISPLAQKIAKDHNIELDKIKGTGHQGKIMKEDVLAYENNSEPADTNNNGPAYAENYEAKIETPDVDPSDAQAKSKHTKTVTSLEAQDIDSSDSQELDYTDTPMSPVHKTIARRMSESYFTSPVFNLEIEVDMKKAQEAITELKDKVMEKSQVKLTITDLIILASTKTLMEHKGINAVIEGDFIRKYNKSHIGLAVGAKDGLIVPVIKEAQQLSLNAIASQRKKLVEKAMEGKLKAGEIEGSTFTISNLGMYGVTSFTSIINQPNSAILSVGAIKDTVVAYKGEITIRPVMNMTLTLDHRVVDGVTGAKFLQTLKGNLENPLKLLIG